MARIGSGDALNFEYAGNFDPWNPSFILNHLSKISPFLIRTSFTDPQMKCFLLGSCNQLTIRGTFFENVYFDNSVSHVFQLYLSDKNFVTLKKDGYWPWAFINITLYTLTSHFTNFLVNYISLGEDEKI